MIQQRDTFVIANVVKQSLPNSAVIANVVKQSHAEKDKIATPISWARNDDSFLDSRLSGNDNSFQTRIRLLRQDNVLPRNDKRIIGGSVIANVVKQSLADKDKIASPNDSAHDDRLLDSRLRGNDKKGSGNDKGE